MDKRAPRPESAPAGEKDRGHSTGQKEVDMEAVARRWDLGMRSVAAILLGLVAIAVLAGAVGGYLTRGTATYVVRPQINLTVPQTAQVTSGVRTTGGYIPGL